jgi:hypothetical protein
MVNEYMEIDDFLHLISSRKINRHQIENIKRIVKLSDNFHKTAKIPKPRYKVDDETIVLESGHQPNFLPYPGVWRKVFLLDYFQNKLESLGEASIPIFGIFDFDLCTTKWLFQNRVPAINKNGFVSIGLKRASGKDMWKRFNSLEKPSPEIWENEIQKIRVIYKNSDTNVLETLSEEMWISYELGDRISEINAILLARLCTRLGLNVVFFRYSDVQQSGLFIDEWKKVLPHIEGFNKIHNEVIKNRGLKNIAPVDLNSAPFWYHCGCGGKVQLYLRSGYFTGTCPVCEEGHEIDDIENEFENLSPKAVMRNIVFSEGLGTSLFISGSGGGLKYGAISNEIARRLGFQNPLTLTWIGKDCYLGDVHKHILNEVRRNLDISENELYEHHSAVSKLAFKRQKLAKSAELQEDAEKYIGRYIYSDTLIKMAYNIFYITPSIVDILFTVGFDGAIDAWKRAIKQAIIKMNEFCLIERDVIYGNQNLRALYDTVKILKEESKKIDPLGILGG